MATYFVWLKLENTILNKIFLLLFAPLCIFINLIGVESSESYFDGIKQYVELNLIVVLSWCILALVGDAKKVKPAMLIIEAVLKTLAAIVATMYLLSIMKDDVNWNQLKVFVNVLSLPLVLAVIWGRLVLELREHINKLLHRCLFALLARYCSNKLALKGMRNLRWLMKTYIINKI